ncbi:MAG: hypothetical protein RLZZ350_2655 [Verrucomicrobiota bacterium]|jgi:hypothetical protein
MKSKFLPLIFCLLPFAFCLSSAAQDTAFTYQGRLAVSNAPANGSFDVQLAVWDALTNGNNVSMTTTFTGVAVSNGLFTVTGDNGPVWTGAARWLEVAVRTNGAGSYTTLTPRQPVTPTPYAIFAASASNLVGTVSSANLAGNYSSAVNLNNAGNTFNGGFNGNFTGAFSGNGATVTNVNAATLGGLASSNFWQLGGNNVGTNQFLGSSNNQPLELRASGQRGLRLELSTGTASLSNGVNVVLGAAGNYIPPSVIAGTIGGGGLANYFGNYFTNVVTADYATIGGGLGNGNGGIVGTIAGGELNTNSGAAGFIGGGYQNFVSGDNSVIGGGNQNTNVGLNATIAGGTRNRALTNAGAVGGGAFNTASGAHATVPGGSNNLAGGNYAFAAGRQAKATNDGAFVWADSQAADFSSTTSNEFSLRATGGVRLVTSNAPATIDGIPILTGSGASALAWQLVSGTTVQAQPRLGYLLTNTSTVSVALPTNATLGDIVRVSGGGTGGWRITQATNQSIRTAALINILGTNGAWASTGVSTQSWRALASSVDGSRLFAAPNPGVIIYSTNGGVNWANSSSPSSNWVAVACSTDGAKLVAATATGYVFTSTDSGVTWTPRLGPATWTSVASSANGTRLYAAQANGNIYSSTNSGSSWTSSVISGQWNALACSADGLRAVAGFNIGNLYTTTDGGSNWTQQLGSPNLLWQAVASSASGSLLVAGSSTTPVYYSQDSGVTWNVSGSPTLNCRGLALSSDGSKILAGAIGVPLMTSTDLGGVWKTNSSLSLSWQAVASSADGGRLVAAVNSGGIYTLQPGASLTTTVGTNGYLIGGPGTAIELQYVAPSQFQPVSHEGSIYAY